MPKDNRNADQRSGWGNWISLDSRDEFFEVLSSSRDGLGTLTGAELVGKALQIRADAIDVFKRGLVCARRRCRNGSNNRRGGVLFVKCGGISMDTTAHSLPFEQTLANIALHASIGDAAAQKNPIPSNQSNLLAGAQVFKENCAFCHRTPGGPQSAASKGMFPRPPQLFTPDAMVTDDPQGVTFWKVTHGIRLSGMPGFSATLSATERWQVTMLVACADKLPRVALSR